MTKQKTRRQLERENSRMKAAVSDAHELYERNDLVETELKNYEDDFRKMKEVLKKMNALCDQQRTELCQVRIDNERLNAVLTAMQALIGVVKP
jgi:hypothetical protein